jgi:hypothetical protein
MMFKRLVMLVRGLMESQSTAPSTLTAEQPSPSAKPLPAKSTQVSRQTARKPVSQKPKSKTSVAQAGTTAPSRKSKPKAARQTSGESGLQVATTASQPASQLRKPKSSTAQKTKAVASPKQTPKLAQLTSGKAGSQAATPVLPTRQPAKPALTKKPKAAVLTSQVKKPTPSKTAARTRTARPSKASGS